MVFALNLTDLEKTRTTKQYGYNTKEKHEIYRYIENVILNLGI